MKTAIDSKPLHILRLEEENVMRLKAIAIQADGRHVKISGPNGSGKTSLLAGLWMAIEGARSDVPEPIHKGEEKALVRLDLGEFLIERKWTKTDTSFVIMTADGKRVPKPREFMDSLRGKISFNPITFLDKRPQDQIADVLAVAGIVAPVEKVRRITGEDIPAKDGESAAQYLDRLAADGDGLWYLRRRESHRAVEAREQALHEQRRALEAMPDAPAAVSALELTQRIDDLQQQDHARRQAGIEVAEATAREAEAERLLDMLKTQHAELQRRIDELRREQAELSARIARGSAMLPALREERLAKAAALAALPDPTDSIAELRARLASIEQTNQAASRRRHAEENVARLEAELAAAKDVHQAHDAILKGLRQLRSQLLAGDEPIVPGLEIGDKELRLHGVPFCQASRAEQTRTACEIIFRQAAKARLRLVWMDDGERLDAESKRIIFEKAKEYQCQVILTAVADDGPLRWEFIEG